MLVILSDLTGIRLHPYSLLSTVPGKMENNAEPTDAKRLRLENGDICESELTSVHNNHVAKISEPQCRRWTLGSYTLLADSDVVDTSWRLECVLHLAGYGQRTGESRTPSWQSAWGGQLVYIAAGEIDELLTVIPTDNALTLVYTGPGTGSFVKYINHSARPLPLETQSTETRRSSVTAPCVYDFAITYHESDSVEPTAMSNALVDEEDDSSEESESVDDDDEDGEFSSANCTLE
ncbi:unnamed protein product [Dicrocoelium dendriticum]|nr:unnamed protein product [Dicrocoelium dendriticum]